MHANQSAMLRDESSLALDGPLGREARTGQGGGQPPGGFVLMDVTGFQLDYVHLRRLPDAFEVAAPQDCSLAQVRAEVVDQDPAVDVTSLG